MNEKLLKYRESLKCVDEMEDELYNMVAFLFKGVNTARQFYFDRLVYNAPGETSELRLSYWICGDEDYITYSVPNTILDDYFDGNKDKAKKDFEQFLIDEEKRREEQMRKDKEERERKQREAEEQAKIQKEIDERNLYEKLKQKYGEN